MGLENILYFIITNFFNYISSFLGFLSIIILIVIIHLIFFLTRDKGYYEAMGKEKDPENILINDLKSLPDVTVIIPAWKEGEVFKEGLNSLAELTYPNLKVIVNAGGDKKTIEIADSFKKYDNFLILRQEKGTSRASMGKIKALNDCFSHINGGIVFLTDADVYFTDEILLRMIYPIINDNEDIVTGSVRPLKSQETRTLVLYLRINRNRHFRKKFVRYQKGFISGANTALKYEVIKSLGKFSETNIFAEDKSRGEDLYLKGYKAYCLNHYESRLFTELPSTIKEWYNQKTRWNENFIFYSFKKKKINLLKPVFFWIYTFCLVLLPFFSFLDYRFLIIWSLLIFNSYSIKLRKLIFYKTTTNRKYRRKIPLKIFVFFIGYIYLESLFYVILPINIIIFLIRKKRASTHL